MEPPLRPRHRRTGQEDRGALPQERDGAAFVQRLSSVRAMDRPHRSGFAVSRLHPVLASMPEAGTRSPGPFDAVAGSARIVAGERGARNLEPEEPWPGGGLPRRMAARRRRRSAKARALPERRRDDVSQRPRCAGRIGNEQVVAAPAFRRNRAASNCRRARPASGGGGQERLHARNRLARVQSPSVVSHYGRGQPAARVACPGGTTPNPCGAGSAAGRVTLWWTPGCASSGRRAGCTTERAWSPLPF